MEYACAAYSFTLVPLYTTLGDDALNSIINEVQMQTICCDTASNAEKIWKLADKKIQNLIVFEHDAKFDEFKSKVNNQIRVLSYHELLEIGQQNKAELRLPKKDDLFLICYTSGSTGTPKGVMMTHQNFMNTTDSRRVVGNKETAEDVQTVHLSYLPLAHIMEQVVMAHTIISGGRSGFMTSSVAELKKDFQFYKPFVLYTVPRILSRIYSNASKILYSNFVFKWIVDYLIDRRIKEQQKGIYNRSGILDTLIFRNIREQFGGQIMFVITGSSPLAEDVMRFTRAAFACPVVEGYGSTETGGVVACTLIGDMNYNHVGALYPGCRVKLIDVPDMNIVVTRDGIGEICVWSNTITKGYYKRPELNHELFDKDGYIRTGDVGKWLPNGALKIVDRCKNIFKLSQGEYVAPEKVEKIYGLCNLVSQVFVDGSSLQPYCIAVLVPNFQQLSQQMSELFQTKHWDLTNPDKGSDHLKEEICQNPFVRQFVLASINKTGREHGLKGFELVKAIHLSPQPFTVENGELTPTLKCARPKIRQHYSEKIAALYKQ